MGKKDSEAWGQPEEGLVPWKRFHIILTTVKLSFRRDWS